MFVPVHYQRVGDQGGLSPYATSDRGMALTPSSLNVNTTHFATMTIKRPIITTTSTPSFMDY